MPHYKIRRVDGDEYADEIEELERASDLPKCPYEGVFWWLTFFSEQPVAYLGLMATLRDRRIAYIPRIGVLKEHRGQRLQLRLMRVAERFARQQGFSEIVSDTTDNPASANNFIRAGFFTYTPVKAWAFSNSIYWRKRL